MMTLVCRFVGMTPTTMQVKMTQNFNRIGYAKSQKLWDTWSRLFQGAGLKVRAKLFERGGVSRYL